MTKLENIPLKQIFELYNILEPEQYREPDDLNDPELKELFTILTNSSLTDAGYDGPNDYHAMYWFAKGRQQSPTQLDDEQQHIKKQNIEFLKELLKNARTLKVFQNKNKHLETPPPASPPAEENRNFIRSYREWLDYNA